MILLYMKNVKDKIRYYFIVEFINKCIFHIKIGLWHYSHSPYINYYGRASAPPSTLNV